MREMEEDPVSEIIRRNASGDADSRQPEGPAKALLSLLARHPRLLLRDLMPKQSAG